MSLWCNERTEGGSKTTVTFPRNGVYFKPDDPLFVCETIESSVSKENLCLIQGINNENGYTIEGLPPGIFKGFETISDFTLQVASNKADEEDLFVTATFGQLPKNPECCGMYKLQVSAQPSSPLCGTSLPPFRYTATIKPFSVNQNLTHRETSWYVPEFPCSGKESFIYHRASQLSSPPPVGIATVFIPAAAGDPSSSPPPDLGLILGLSIGIPVGIVVLALVSWFMYKYCNQESTRTNGEEEERELFVKYA
jgi:hypothetical protein